MSILEILEAHQIGSFSSDGHNRVMTCSGCREQLTGQGLSLDEIIRAHLAEVLDKHMQEREAEAVRETSRYLQRIFPRKGLVNRADILADIEIAAGRLGRGIHANGRDKRPANGRE